MGIDIDGPGVDEITSLQEVLLRAGHRTETDVDDPAGSAGRL